MAPSKTYANPAQASLPGVKPGKPAKARRQLPKKVKRPWKNGFRPGRPSLGLTIPPLLQPDNQPYRCPCGRATMMRDADGGVFIFDSEAPLGSQGGKHYYGPIERAIAAFKKNGCRLHPEPDPYEPSEPAEPPEPSDPPHPYWK